MTEWGNWVADGIAGSARKMAEKEEKEWVAQVDKWNAEVDRRERLGGITKEVAKPVRARAAPLIYAGVEIGEQHAMAAVLGRPGGDRSNRDVGARNIAERILY
jgi:hypothetical protein